MKNYLGFSVAVILIVSAGLVHGYMTGWIGHAQESALLKDFSERVLKVPMQVGDWVGEDEGDLDERVRAIAGSDASIQRTYRNNRTNQVVSFYLTSGHFRSIAQHTPNQCYVAAGFNMMKAEIPYNVTTDAGTVECYTAVFNKDESSGSQYLRVFWTWSYDGQWIAPSMPRMELRGQPALYKMYFRSDAHDQSVERSPCIEFMRDFVPTLNKVLFPDASNDAAAGGTTEAGGTPSPTVESSAPTAEASAPAEK